MVPPKLNHEPPLDLFLPGAAALLSSCFVTATVAFDGFQGDVTPYLRWAPYCLSNTLKTMIT
jgi:hypothetical protein